MGGSNRKTEAEKLSRGVQPGGVHARKVAGSLQNTPTFNFKNLQCLVIDGPTASWTSGSRRR